MEALLENCMRSRKLYCFTKAGCLLSINSS